MFSCFVLITNDLHHFNLFYVIFTFKAPCRYEHLISNYGPVHFLTFFVQSDLFNKIDQMQSDWARHVDTVDRP